MKLTTALKHVFIPHEHNDYKPHFFRELSVAVIIIGSIFMLGFSAGSSFLIRQTVLGANISAAILVDLTNESRLAYNQAPLVRNPVLDLAAELKAEDMATVGYFAHDSPTGVPPWHWFRKVGYTFLYAGENLAINFIEAAAVRDAWLQSPTHRANLLDVKFKEIGMATVSSTYKDSPAIYVVQMFGTPAKAAVVNEGVPIKRSPGPASAVSTQTKTNLTIAQAPEIKGDSSVDASSSEPTISSPSYKSLIATPELVVVKNSENVEPISARMPVERYSKWYERFLFGGSYYVSLAYKALIVLVFVALLTMIFIEIRKQHWRHITYGVVLLFVLSLCITVNQTFF